MKKVILLAILTLLLSGYLTNAMADVDFSAMTTDELITLRDSINDELIARIGINNESREEHNESILPVGDYLVGRDIKAGTYLITCLTKEEYASCDMCMGIFDDEGKYIAGKDGGAYYSFRENTTQFIEVEFGRSAIITLKDGEHFIVKFGQGTCVSHNPTWAP